MNATCESTDNENDEGSEAFTSRSSSNIENRYLDAFLNFTIDEGYFSKRAPATSSAH